MDDIYTYNDKGLLQSEYQYLIYCDVLASNDFVQTDPIIFLNAIDLFDATKSITMDSFFSYRIRWALTDKPGERNGTPG
ncbi:hypothetical protein [Klebsiella sp. BIGb0407]|uniref:hypothetical protein n=1 Tax=Klebsiella sp. BIGb0407 TaxID=2940603 RepID=UPI002166CD35|nr:hypothetical protein [Klebsiella sp. BIGb0407]MCS3433953.1 DNA-directed RNA polymerase specialized sigma subunit [Klebsiella sp. BIGb0407]